MDRNHRDIRKQVGFIGAICGSLLIGLPALAIPQMETVSQRQRSQNPNPSIRNEAPYNRARTSNSGSSLNPNPAIFNEAPYNRSGRGTSSDTPSMMSPTGAGTRQMPSNMSPSQMNRQSNEDITPTIAPNPSIPNPAGTDEGHTPQRLPNPSQNNQRSREDLTPTIAPNPSIPNPAGTDEGHTPQQLPTPSRTNQ